MSRPHNPSTSARRLDAAVGGLLAGLALASLPGCGASAPMAGSNGMDSISSAAMPGGMPSAKHACKGQNACKGQGGCKSGDNGCAGKNSCKGKGGCASPPQGM